MVSLGSETCRADPLRSPIDVEARRALVGRSIGSFTCESPVPPVREILADSFYTDPEHSIVDPDREAAHKRAVKPLQNFLAGLTRMSDRFVASAPPQPEAARCALLWLDAWAQADAMLGKVTQQGRYERKWMLAGVALAYLKIRDAPDLDARAKARVQAWLARLMAAVKPDYDRPPGRGHSSVINNHLYWAALAVAAGAIATDDHDAFVWAIGKYRFALAQITDEGMLPLEIARGRRALHYHGFAVAPLVLLAEIGTANGIDLYGEWDGALRRLVARVVEGVNDPGSFARRTGRTQDLAGGPSGWHLAWAEIWYARTRDASLVPLIQRFRPMRNNWLGGDLTLTFGVPTLPTP